MIPIGEHATRPSSDPIDGTREARTDRHHSATERFTVATFNDQVSVVPLQGIVHQAKAGTSAARREASFDLTHDTCGAQRGQVRPETKRHVRWQRSAEDLAAAVG